MIISLTGFMGCGKSSVGRRLSELLCCPFMDLDAEIEERCGCTVAAIFAERGEAEFRRIEKETLKDILETGGRVLEISPSSSTPARKNQEHPSNERPQMILALGGGAVMTPECEQMVHGQTKCIYLRTSVEELVARLTDESAGRPLLASSDLKTRIETLMSLRMETYERTAHHIISTDSKTIDEVASEITAALPARR
jgi:shikimate kinase